MVEPLKSLLILIGNSGQVFGIAYLRDELTDGTIEVWFYTTQNHPMIQQHQVFLRLAPLSPMSDD
jgi:hypothetical protein